jgi:hypothetical protein
LNQEPGSEEAYTDNQQASVLCIGAFSIGRQPILSEPGTFPQVQQDQEAANRCSQEAYRIEYPNSGHFSFPGKIANSVNEHCAPSKANSQGSPG